MNRLKPIEIRWLWIFSGFFTGTILLLLIVLLSMNLLGLRAQFSSLNILFNEYQVFYLFLLIPLLGGLFGYVVATSIIRLETQITQNLEEEIRKADYIKSVLTELTYGNLNMQIAHEALGQELEEKLISLQSKLKENIESQKRIRRSDSQRNWISSGLAEFGDILRSHSNDIEALSTAVISTLVPYLDINQGGFFIVEESDEIKQLRLLACYAYDRKKFPGKTLEWGEGIVGAVAIEKKSYYTDKIPEAYLDITSGLGRANPRHLLIVPMVLNEEVFGVLELASFKEFPSHHIQFIERVAENTATTLNILRSNTQTEVLLKETQEQAAKLALQEEEVRKNIEELKSTQLEAARQSEQFIRFSNTVNHTLIRAEYNADGYLIYANTRFLKKLGYSGSREVNGRHISQFIHVDDREWFDGIWKRLSEGGMHYEGYMRHITKMGMDLWTVATYTCMRRDDGSVEKILFLSLDSSEHKEQSLEFEGQLAAINTLVPRAEFQTNGQMLYANDKLLSALNYTREDLIDYKVFDFISRTDMERFTEIWESVLSGEIFQGQLRMMGRYEDELWFSATLRGIESMSGEIKQILLIAYEISKEKELEVSMRAQSEKLKAREEESKLLSLDLRKQIDDDHRKWEQEKIKLELENRRNETIIDRFPDPLIIINNQRFILFYNKAAQKLFKCGSKMTGLPINELINPATGEDSLEAILNPSGIIKELESKKIHLHLKDRGELLCYISISEISSGSELIYSLIIRED